MAPQRLTYRRRHAYNTRSNKSEDSGGKLTFHYLTKKPNPPLCGECRTPIAGVPALRPKAYRTLKPHHRTVSRAYGGNMCAHCLRQRIVRAFLVEEQKIVKSVLKQRKANEKKTDAAPATTTKA